METKLSITTVEGQQEVTLSVENYRAAEQQGMTFSQYINNRFPTNAQRDGTAFAQLMAASGLVLSEDRHFGIRPPTLAQVFDGTAQLNGSAVTAPDGSQRNTPAGRLLFPAVLIDMLEDQLRDNREGYNALIMDMVAFTRSINSPRYDQVKIDLSGPRAARGQMISQLAEPTRMLSITTSSVQRSIPTYSIGMEISREALQAATLDLIGLAVREHALEERAAQLEGDLKNIVDGSVDSGDTALTSITATSLDSTISNVAGALTQKAWVKYMRQGWRTRTLTHIICDLDTYLNIEKRTGRPVKDQEAGQDERLNTLPRASNPGLPDGVKIFITETSLLGANTLVGLDKSKAIRRIVYAGAPYEAIQDFVMRKSVALRMDWAERLESAGYSQAFSKMTLT